MLVEYNASILNVAFQPEHHLLRNPNWPEFYIFATGTVTRAIEIRDDEEDADEEVRVSDGVLYSEYAFR